MDSQVDAVWQVQEAKQRFSAVLRAAEAGKPQVITRHGVQVAVLLGIEAYHQVADTRPDFATFLRGGPDFDDLPLERAPDLTAVVELAGGA